MIKHGSVIRPTMYLASMDIKTDFDVARPKHIARIMEGHTVHGWIIAALLSETAGLEGLAMLECAESSFSIVAEDGHAGSWKLWNKDERRKEWASFKI